MPSSNYRSCETGGNRSRTRHCCAMSDEIDQPRCTQCNEVDAMQSYDHKTGILNISFRRTYRATKEHDIDYV